MSLYVHIFFICLCTYSLEGLIRINYWFRSNLNFVGVLKIYKTKLFIRNFFINLLKL